MVPVGTRLNKHSGTPVPAEGTIDPAHCRLRQILLSVKHDLNQWQTYNMPQYVKFEVYFGSYKTENINIIHALLDVLRVCRNLCNLIFRGNSLDGIISRKHSIVLDIYRLEYINITYCRNLVKIMRIN